MKCIICDKRPRHNGQGYCSICDDRIAKLARARKPVEAFRYLTYRGHVVAMNPNGRGTYTPVLSKRTPEKLPKGKTLDLNTYLDGFSRATIKRLKACVLNVANA